VSKGLLERLQSVTNAAARLVFSARKHDHITPLLRDFHWLRIPEQIHLRLCVLVYRCLHETPPSYLAESIHRTTDNDARRRLRSSKTSTLLIPPSRRSTLGNRAFSVAASRAWNNLPPSTREAPTLTIFRRELKTFLFSSSFDQQ
jgi:hypothetical protein